MREKVKENIEYEHLRQELPYDDVESLLELIVIDSMSQTTTKINNIRAYLLTALYNAPITIGPYYSAAVRHDFG